jgi:hypothetical protein
LKPVAVQALQRFLDDHNLHKNVKIARLFSL